MYPRNTFDDGGNHDVTVCDSRVNITTEENLAPLFVELNDDVDDNLVPEYTFSVTGSAIDPESADLTLTLEIEENLLEPNMPEFVEGSQVVEISSGVCVDDNGVIENVACNSNTDCEIFKY